MLIRDVSAPEFTRTVYGYEDCKGADKLLFFEASSSEYITSLTEFMSTKEKLEHKALLSRTMSWN